MKMLSLFLIVIFQYLLSEFFTAYNKGILGRMSYSITGSIIFPAKMMLPE